jgi:micrococcal nuclease
MAVSLASLMLATILLLALIVSLKMASNLITLFRLPGAALFAAVVVIGAVSCGVSPGATERQVPDTVTVTRIIDGDTVEISPSIDGIEDVRLIGVDTPEVSGDCGREPLADAAEDYTARYAGERMSLELGEERTDQYGRLLAYLRPQEAGMLNEELVREGLAQVATFPPNVEYEDEFLRAQARAREEGVGIWGLPPDQQELLADRGNGIGGGC